MLFQIAAEGVRASAYVLPTTHETLQRLQFATLIKSMAYKVYASVEISSVGNTMNICYYYKYNKYYFQLLAIPKACNNNKIKAYNKIICHLHSFYASLDSELETDTLTYRLSANNGLSESLYHALSLYFYVF